MMVAQQPPAWGPLQCMRVSDMYMYMSGVSRNRRIIVIGELSEQEKRDGYHMHILNLVKYPQNDCGHRKYAVNERMLLKNWRYLTHSKENVGSVHKCPSRVAKGCPPLVTGPAAGTNYITHKQHTGHWLMVGQRVNTSVYCCYYYYHPYHYLCCVPA